MADGESLDPEELYGLDPNDFVAARNELAKALRKAGDRELAAEVAKLRRPTPAAWVVNQLVRHHRGDVEELVRLGEALREAQDEALAGGSGDLRQAGRARRDAVARLAERAEELLIGRGGGAGAHTGEVTATLEAASLDADAAEAVLGGRLSVELQPPSGFGVFDLPVAERRAERKKPPAGAADEAGPPPAEVRKAEEAAAEARRQWEERSAQARAAVERVDESRKAARQAEAEIARLEDQLADAQRRLRAAVREAELAEDKASRAEDAEARAAERRRDADQRLAELTG
jgi:hypothetical protein